MIWRWEFFHSFRSYVLSTTITRYSYKHDWQYLWPARIYSAAGGVTTAPKFYFTHWYSSQLVDYMDGKIWLTYASSSILEYHLPLSAIFSFKNWDCFTQPPLKSWAHPHHFNDMYVKQCKKYSWGNSSRLISAPEEWALCIFYFKITLLTTLLEIFH